MPTFQYTALDSENNLVAGEVQADSLMQAIEQLQNQSLTLQVIGLAGQSEMSEADAQLAATEASNETLESYLRTVLPSFLPMVPALRARASELPPGNQREPLLAVAKVIEQQEVGAAAEAVKEYPDFWIPLLSGGNSPEMAETQEIDALTLGSSLTNFISQSRHALEISRQRWLAFAYPLSVSLLAFGVLAVLCIFVVPTFDELYSEFGLQLPAMTSLLIAISRLLRSGALIAIIVLLVILPFALRFTWHWLPRRVRQRAWEWFELPLPIRTHRHTSLARFATFTAGLLDAGLPTPVAVELAGESCGRISLEGAALQYSTQLRSHDMPTQAEIPRAIPLAIHHALCGDVSPAARSTLLRAFGESHNDQARRKLNWIYDLYGPIALIVVGLIVFFAVSALYIPLVSLIENLS